MAGRHSSELLVAPHSRNLSTLAAVKEEINLGADTSSDAFVNNLLGQASSEIEAKLGYPLYRAHVRESFPGPGGSVLQLDRRPVHLLTEVTYLGVAQDLTGYDISDEEHGQIVSVGRWDETVRRDWGVSYWGGYLLPGDNVADGGFTAAALDKSFNSTALLFPILLPGEWVLAGSGWNTANQGLHRVVTSTAGKIVVEETLVDDLGSAVKALGVSTLPDHLERACLQLTKILFHDRDKHPGIVSQEIDGVAEKFDLEAARKDVELLIDRYIAKVPSLVISELVRA